MKKELITHEEPKSPISEVFRTLRVNIQFMNTKKNSKVILLTSTYPNEGKSWISSNLAVAFAQAGKTVILIDADMRKGRQYSIFGVSPKPGLSNYLSGIGLETEDKREINNEENYIQETNIKNLYLVTSGDIPPNPSELLISPKMKKLIEKLKEKSDIIIIDGTPCNLVTDSLVLVRLVDTTIVITAHKQTKKDDLKKVIESIKDVGGKNIGIVLNKIPISTRKYENSYYYGSTNKKSKSKEQSVINSKDDQTDGNKNGNKQVLDKKDKKAGKSEISKERKQDIIKQMNDFMNEHDE